MIIQKWHLWIRFDFYLYHWVRIFLKNYKFKFSDKIPEALGLENLDGQKIKAKQFFPHGFNVPENYGKIAPTHPDKKNYYYSTFLKAKREKFDKWYNEVKDTPFDLSKSLVEYCKNDVE